MITWNVLRAAGIGAYLMLWASVAWGLLSTTSIFGKKVSKQTNIALHQAFSTMGLVLLATHIGFLLADRFMPFAPLDLIVPMRASYRPVGVTLGIAAMLVTILGVLSTSWGRKLIGTKWWRRTHSLSVPAFTLALVHGLMTGTDTRRPTMFWMYVATAAVLLFLLVVRALTAGERPQRAKLPDGVVPRAPARVTSTAPSTVEATAPLAPPTAPEAPTAPVPAAPQEEPVAPEEEPAAASASTDPSPRRRTPLAPKPVPVIFVQTQAAAAPPGLRIVDGTGALAEPPPAEADGDPDVGASATGDHLAPVIPLDGARHTAHGAGGAHRQVEGDVQPPTGAQRRGHAPTPHPKTRSPDLRAL
jgi:DMSO/TMAO reductase YedYZ heme-binding membrane subunit